VDVSLIGNEKARQQIYNGAGHEITSVLGCIELMARAVCLRPEPGWQQVAFAASGKPLGS
jgi:hypothetical protein